MRDLVQRLRDPDEETSALRQEIVDELDRLMAENVHLRHRIEELQEMTWDAGRVKAMLNAKRWTA